MRRWVCIVTLLAGFTRDAGDPRRRSPLPVPIERPIGPHQGRTTRTAAWWRN